MDSRAQTFGMTILFEAGIGFAGILLAQACGVPIWSSLVMNQEAIARGLIATFPMLAGLLVLSLSRWTPLVELRRQVESIVKTLFAESNWLELALISLSAGVGEELMFRGALQPILANWVPPVVAISVVSLLFGLAHAMSKAYFVAATAIGLYLGWLALAFDDLIAPIVAHGLYDFIALTYVQQRVRRG